MAVAKVTINGSPIIDLTDATASADKILTNYTAYIKDGTKATGTASGGGTINNQNKSVTPTESQQSVTADSGYTGLGTVTVGAISSTYVGSGITRRSSSNLTISGSTVTAPSGYYASSASATVPVVTYYTGTSAPSSSLGSNGDIYLRTS